MSGGAINLQMWVQRQMHFQFYFSILVWDFQQLLIGSYPMEGPASEEVSGWYLEQARARRCFNYRGALISKCPDWDWLGQVCGLQGWQPTGPCKRICFKCRAGKRGKRQRLAGVLDAFDPTLNAPWRQTAVDMTTFYRDAVDAGKPVSVLFQIPGCTIDTVKIDWKHVVDLGLAQTLGGECTLDLFISVDGRFTNAKLGCSRVMVLLKSAAAEADTSLPFSELKWTMFRAKPKSRPLMKLKAAQTRYYIQILFVVFDKNSLKR